MQIVETMFEARAPGECSVTRAVLEDLIAATDTWVGREIFVVHRIKGLNKLTHTRCFAEEGGKPPMSVVVNETDAGIAEHPNLTPVGERIVVDGGFESYVCKTFEEAIERASPGKRIYHERVFTVGAKPKPEPVDSAAWTGRAGDVPEKPKEQAKPNPVPTPADMRDDLIRRLTDCARDLDTMGFRCSAETVRRARNCVKRGDKAAPPESPLDRAWEHLRQADRALVDAREPSLGGMVVLLRDEVAARLSKKRPAPANCTELDRADKMGGALQSDFGVGRGPVPETRSANFDDVRKAERETGRQEGLRQAIRDIETYPTAFAMAMKRNLVDLIQERIRGER
ncbi:MAG: hypothetical protein E6Q97_18650 [Desulfurellales bacterium]|nr:MAG: hypothetical protein E6Q97_18650 [Desulfurellales bacterium]